MTMKFAFSGKMRSGKDASADYVESRLKSMGFAVTRLAFAETLKRIAVFAQEEAGVPVVKDRELLQYIGVHFREINPNVWVDALARRIQEDENAWDSDVILVTDLRFPNEFEMLKNAGFTLVRTYASDSIRVMRGAEIEAMDHISETALDAYDAISGSWDWAIKNESSLEDLHSQLDRVIARGILYAEEE